MDLASVDFGVDDDGNSFPAFGALLCVLLVATIGAMARSIYRDHKDQHGAKKKEEEEEDWSLLLPLPPPPPSSLLTGDFVSGMLTAMLLVLAGHHVCDYVVSVLVR